MLGERIVKMLHNIQNVSLFVMEIRITPMEN